MEGCYEEGKAVRMKPADPNHFYNFENIPIEVHPVLKENKHRPIKEVELDEPPTHPILTFFKWLFFFFFIVFLIIGIVLLILMILNKGKGKDDGEIAGTEKESWAS